MSDSGQKFIGRNRAPRVQIEYDLETGGAQRKIELPFVMGIMSNLKGKYEKEDTVVPVQDREFDQISSATFDAYLRDMKPRLNFNVANKLSGEEDPEKAGLLNIKMTIETMKDFTPGKIAENVPELKELLDARNQLKNLMSFMDGNPEAEKLIASLLQEDNSELLQSLLKSKGAEKSADGEEKDGVNG